MMVLFDIIMPLRSRSRGCTFQVYFAHPATKCLQHSRADASCLAQGALLGCAGVAQARLRWLLAAVVEALVAGARTGPQCCA